MQVISKLVKMNFKIAKLERDGDHLVITSDPTKSMLAKVYLAPDDLVDVLKWLFHWGVLSYLVTLPVLLWRSKRTAAAEKK